MKMKTKKNSYLRNFCVAALVSLLAQCVWAGTIPAPDYSHTMDSDTMTASTKLGGATAISFVNSDGDWATGRATYTAVRNSSTDKAMTLASNVTPYNEGSIAGNGSFSFLTVAKLVSTTSPRVIASISNASWGANNTGLTLVYVGNNSVKLVLNKTTVNNTAATATELVTTTVEDAESQYHSYLVTFDKTVGTITLYVDGNSAGSKSTTETIGYKGYQFGGVYGGTDKVKIGDTACAKGEGFMIDEIALWKSDVSSVAADIAALYPVWPKISKEINVSANTNVSDLTGLASIAENEEYAIVIASGVKLTLDTILPGLATIRGAGTLYVPAETSATLKSATVEAAALVEGSLTTQGAVALINAGNKFTNTSTWTIDSGTSVISGCNNGSNGDRGLMGAITIEKGATLTINKGDAINYSAGASEKTVLNIKGTLDCGNRRQSFKANNIVNLYVGGTIIGTGDGYAALDFTDNDNNDIIHVLDDANVATKTATISAVMRSNAASRPIAIDVSTGVNLTVSGVIKQGKITKTGDGTLTLSATNTYTGGTDINAGTIKTSVTANLSGKTITVNENGTLEYAKSGTGGDWDFDDNNLSGITGTGKIKFSGSGFLTLAPDSAGKLWADTLEVVNELGDGFLMESGVTYTIGSLSGTGKFRYDCSSDKRTLVVKQSKETTWSGGSFNDGGTSPGTRALDIVVTSENGSALIYTGANSHTRTKLIAGEGGTIKSTSNGGLGEATLGLNGGTIDLDEGGFGVDGKGYTIVSDGGTITKTSSTGNAYSRIIKSLTLDADTAVTGKINGIGTHSDTAATLALGSNTLTVTMDEAWNNGNGYGNFYFYNTTISGEGTIKMVKGNLLVHTKATTAADATIEIGENASIQLDGNGSALTVKNLIIQKHNSKNFQSGSTITVTGTFTCNDTVPVSKVTLAEGAAVTTTVSGKIVVIDNGVYTLKDIVAKIGDTPYASIEDAIAHLGEGQNVTAITLVDKTITTLPDGQEEYKIVDGEIVAKSYYTITVAENQYVTVEGVPTAAVREDAEAITFTVTPATGYNLTAVKANGTALTAGENGVYTIKIAANTEITIETIKIEITEEEVTATTEEIQVGIPEGADSIVIESVDVAIAADATAIPFETGVYTITAKKGDAVVATETLAVVKTKDAESGSSPDPVTTAVAVPFKGATVANLLNTALLNEGDVLKALNSAQEYYAWTLDANKKWQPISVTRESGTEQSPTADETELKRGAAVWVTTAGKVVAFGTYEDTSAEPEVVSGYNLIGNPMMTAITPAAKTVGDVLIPVGGTKLVRYKVIEKAGGTKVWQCTKSVPVTIPGLSIDGSQEDISEKDPTVQVGGSVWLIK